MPLPALFAQIDRVQTLVHDLKVRQLEFPTEQYGDVITELERFADYLEGRLAVDQGSPASKQETTPGKTAESEVLAGRLSWLERSLKEAHVGAWERDTVTGEANWSGEMYELYGVLPALGPIPHEDFINMVSPDDRAKIINEFSEAAENDGRFSHEFRVACPNGKTIWVHSAGRVVTDASGQVIRISGISQDITDRRRAEAALRESKQREREGAAELAALMDAVPAIIWISRDPKCEHMVGNRYGYEFLQMWAGANISKSAAEAELGLQPYRNFRDGREIPANELPMQIAAATGQGTRDYEFQLVFRDGTAKNLLGNIVPLLDQSGKPGGAVAVFVDITERKHIEEELARKEAELREAQRLAHIGNWYWDIEADTTAASEEVFRILGLDPATYVLPPFQEQKGRLYPSEAWERLNAVMQTAIETGSGYELDLEAYRANEPIWITARGEAVRDPNGRVIGLRGTTQDITQRKRAEEALRQSQEMFEASIESMSEGFVVFSAVREKGSGDGPGKIVDLCYEYVNEAACRINGRTREQMVGHTLLELFPDSPEIDLFDEYVAVIETGQSLLEQNFVHERESGGKKEPARVLDIRAAKVRDGLVRTRADITERVRLENERREAITQMVLQQRLKQQTEKERQSIARDIHDGPLQTLLAIAINIQMVKEAYTDPSLHAELNQIGVNVKSASQELRQVISELRPPLLLQFGLAEAIKLHAEEVQARLPQIKWQYELLTDGHLLPEPVRLTLFRIYQEATSNIVRHSQATRAWVRFRQEEDRVVLEIGDNGKGLPEKYDPSSLDSHGHYGLTGMAERAVAIAGEIEITSRPGSGTTVNISVPLEKPLATEGNLFQPHHSSL
jgi:PAS domain S-box-containing protein